MYFINTRPLQIALQQIVHISIDKLSAIWTFHRIVQKNIIYFVGFSLIRLAPSAFLTSNAVDYRSADFH